MKKFMKIIIMLLIMFSISACSPTTSYNANISREISKNLTEVRHDFEIPKSYLLSQCFWYDDNKMLFAFEKSGEKEMLKLYGFDLNTNTSTLIYDGPFSVEYTNSFLLNNQRIGYQNEQQAIILNKNNWDIIAKTSKKDMDLSISFSPDMRYLAEISENGIYITTSQSGQKKVADKVSKEYNCLTWANDSSKLLYITNDYSDISVIEIASNRKQMLRGGQDFKYPEEFVNLVWCHFLPDNSNILVQMLCENNDVFSILNYNGNNVIQKTIAEKGNITIMDFNNSSILYTCKYNKGQTKLIRYNYLNGNKKVIFNTPSFINFASFSPHGDKIIFTNNFDEKQVIYIYHVDKV